MNADTGFGSLPMASVIMPVRNEARFLDSSLGSVLRQDYPSDRLEVLVADGMSDDGTRARLEELRRKHPNLTLIDNPGRIVATGLNAAIRRARGEILVRVDGHTEIAPDYVRQCVAALQKTRADNVGGRMTAEGSGVFGRAVAAATSSPFGVGAARFHYSDREEWVDTVYLGAWRRQVFAHIGLFDEELVRDQDDEFNYRLRAAGGRILLSPAIRSRYTVRATPSRLWRQYFQYGYWKVRVLQKHPRQMQPRQFVPPLFVLTLLGLAVQVPFSSAARAVFAAVAMVYVIANLVAAGLSARGRLKAVPPIVLAFAILHVSYGAGFLAGLIRFAFRWRDARPRTQMEGRSSEPSLREE